MIILHIPVITKLKHGKDQGIPFFRDFGSERGIHSTDVNIAKLLQNYTETNKKKQNGNLKKVAVHGNTCNIQNKIVIANASTFLWLVTI